MKIRIFALAKEMGLDSKVLIDYCNAAGIELKSSPLAAISPEERDIVLNHIKQQSESRTEPAAAMAPVREAVETGSRVRQIKNIPVKPIPAPTRARREGTESDLSVATLESPPAVEAEPEVAAEPEAPHVAPAPTEVVAEAPPETAAPAPAVPEEPAVPEQQPAPTVVAEAPAVAAPAAPAAPAVPTKAPSEASPTAPMRRDEYISSSGRRVGTVPDMRPRGTVESETKAKAVREGKTTKPKPALPVMAAPPMVRLPKPKKEAEEAPAQKPEVRLTPDILAAPGPLLERIQKGKIGETKDKTDKKKVPLRPGLPGADLRRQMESEEGEGRAKTEKGGRRTRGGGVDQEDEGGGRRIIRRIPKPRGRGAAVLKTEAEIDAPITLRSLSEAVGRPANLFIKSLFMRGQKVTINDPIDEELAVELAMEVGVDLHVKRARDVEQELEELLVAEDPPESLVPRAPIVTILGHVDHGKTTLLDKLRSANVAAGEAGGITQHIAAYQVDQNGRKITFVDTPGHAAFGEMRARGANVTDIVVLVVAANDGVMPQTVECISHAKAAGAPIVVAMNKVDLPDINEQRVLQGLAQHDILPVEWGGDVEVVRTSGATGKGLDDLLETLLLTADLHELKGNPDRPAVGVCLEAFRDEGRGVLAWLIVRNGTLRIGDVVLCGQAAGRIRAIYNDRDEELQEAPPSMPVKVAGLDVVPGAGDKFWVLGDVDEARQIADRRRQSGRAESLAGTRKPMTIENILEIARGGVAQDLPLIVKADTPGSLEALRGELEKFEHPEVRVRIVHQGVGGVNESDVSLAAASGAVVIAFHVIAEDRAAIAAERTGVEIKRYNIIYEVTDEIRRNLEGLLKPEQVEVATGRALVLQTFDISRFGRVAGCRVLSGTIERSHKIHLIRDQKLVSDYAIASLKREKDDAKEVREGMECGIRLEGFNDVKVGDLLEAFRIDVIKRTLD